MLSARNAGLVAMAASLGALLASFLYIPALVLKINQINEQLRVDSDEFKVIADAAWSELTQARFFVRTRRQVSQREDLCHRPMEERTTLWLPLVKPR